MASLGAAAIALVLVLALTPAWMRLAPRIGAIDWPRGRHAHERPTPTAGGVVIVVAVWAAALVVMQRPLALPVIGIFLAVLLLLLLSVYDDIHGVPAGIRLLAQCALALAVYAWGVRIEGTSNFLGLLGRESWVELGWLSCPLTVLWIVLLTNAMNWLDGIDGLTAGVAAISAFTLGLMATFSPATGMFPAIAVLGCAVAGACLGFLRYNFAPAKVFMGDAGAMCLGFLLGCVSALGALKGPTAAAVLLPLLVMGVPLYDSTTTVAKRVMNGKNPLAGDRTHIQHRLLDRGFSVKQAALVVYGFSAVLCLIALWLWWK